MAEIKDFGGSGAASSGGEQLWHEDYEWLARFARDLVVAVARYNGKDGHASLNEEQALAWLRHALANPHERERYPLGLTTASSARSEKALA